MRSAFDPVFTATRAMKSQMSVLGQLLGSAPLELLQRSLGARESRVEPY